MIKGVDDTKMGIGMRIAFVIYKLGKQSKKATFEEISKDSLLQGISEQQLKESLKLIWDWGHLSIHERIGKQMIPVYSLTYPEAIRELGLARKWIIITLEFPTVDSLTKTGDKE
jgi:hypothetical protein